MKLNKPTVRHKKSKFDPYINEISSYLDAETSIKSICEELDHYFNDIVCESALYAFVRSRGLETIYKGGKNQTYIAPRCDQCEGCHEVMGLNNKMVRMCYSSRLISGSIRTSPPWCCKRKEARENANVQN